MKILLTTLNAKFVHTSLALWYLYQYSRHEFPELSFREFNINQDLNWICGEIYLERASVIAFSCNIWNIEPVLIICRRIKAVAPQTVIILGGPEVSDDPAGILAANPAVDFIVSGEGEVTFHQWLQEFHRAYVHASGSPDWSGICGLTFRVSEGRGPGRPVRNPDRKIIPDLSCLPFPYPEDLTVFQYKLVYYESSRGCPFHCQYCLSANENEVRFFPLERVQRELLKFIEAGIRQVKFVDRSFNCNPKWAKSIWRFLIECVRNRNYPVKTNFHFEIVGDLLDDESIAILHEAPPGLFQFEIGVQTTNPEALALIKRCMDFQQLSCQVGKLVSKRNVFVHLDLIAGLPGEDYESFARTFNDNLRLEPHRLQLGFLKLLHGSGLRDRADEFGYIFTPESPYEVMANDWISYAELLGLKLIEDLLECYYNSGRFWSTFRYLLKRASDPFRFFEGYASWWKVHGLDQISHKEKELYRYLLNYYRETGGDEGVLKNLLKYDLLHRERLVELPDWAGAVNEDLKDLSFQFWRDPANRARFPEFDGLAIRDIQRRVLIAEFDFDPEALAANPESDPIYKNQLILFIYSKNETRVFNVSTNAKEIYMEPRINANYRE
ncbi:MAG TPA: B12-binding domain-containing radical SAM protein [Bacillota bacterium]|nr:B12-binding domain-containing radical SAM protein [Bacillota bacterium]